MPICACVIRESFFGLSGAASMPASAFVPVSYGNHTFMFLPVHTMNWTRRCKNTLRRVYNMCVREVFVSVFVYIRVCESMRKPGVHLPMLYV